MPERLPAPVVARRGTAPFSSPGWTLPALVLAVVAVLAGAAAASTGPSVWVQSSFEDFAGGDLDAISLAADGSLVLPPRRELLHDTETPYVWDAALADDGTVFYAVGSEGDVYRLPPGGEPGLFFSVGGNVHAMLVGGDDHLYATSSPGGFVWRVGLDGGVDGREAWFEPGERYAWSLAWGADDRLYVGTGVDGQIYAAAADGEGEVHYDSDQTHVTALAVDAAGNLLAGTEEGGQVFRISTGTPPDVFVLYDSPLRQITGLVPTDRGLFVAGIGAGAPTDAGESEGDDEPASATGADTAAADLAGAVYLIHGDGYVERLWSSEAESVHAMTAWGRGVVIGTGPGGRLLEIDAAGEATILGSVDAAQITALRAAGDGTLLVATSNLGKLFRLGDGYRDAGEYVSAVKDTETTSRWGRVRWRAVTPPGTVVRLLVRTGNTEEPDRTWSDWSGPYTEAAGSPLDLEAARFVQWKAELETTDAAATPVLDRVELVYVQRNLRPEIDEFRVHPGGVVYRQTGNVDDLAFAQVPASVQAELDRQAGRDGPGATSTTSSFLGRPLFVSGRRTFTWSASDPNGDELVYSLAYRAEDEGTWKTFAAGVTERLFTWDTTTVPDGRYVARVRADDQPSNPDGQALAGEERSDSFVIDNTPPRITGLMAATEGNRVRVRGTATDDVSLILGLEYAVDGGDWHAVAPADGLADTETEEIDLLTRPLDPGEHTVVVRAVDAALNRGADRVVVTVAAGEPGR